MNTRKLVLVAFLLFAVALLIPMEVCATRSNHLEIVAYIRRVDLEHRLIEIDLFISISRTTTVVREVIVFTKGQPGFMILEQYENRTVEGKLVATYLQREGLKRVSYYLLGEPERYPFDRY